MILALLRAIVALAQPTLRRVVGLSLLLAVLTFAALWLGIAALLYDTVLFEWRPLDWLLDLLGGVTVLLLSWLLFPSVVTLVMGLFIERVAAAIEALDYPGREPPRRQPIGEILGASLRLTGLTLVLNLLALPLYLFLPGINLLLFLGLNGYLLGREYFEVVALRRLESAPARSLRHRFGGRVFFGGVIIAGLFALPLVNLVAPVIATAFMVHLFEALRAESFPLTRSV
jgi:CysZ protein